MKLLFLIFTLHLASAGSHFLDYFFTGVSPGTNCPEFTAIAHLDGLQAGYYECKSKTLIFRQEWIKGIKDDEHWNQVTEYAKRFQYTVPDHAVKVMELFDQTGVPPEVSLFQKESSSPVVCHATGFYPKLVNITWQKNGEDLDEGVELRETLPNQDGTFQRRSILTVSPEELDKHANTCIIQHSSLEKEMMLHVVNHRAAVFIGIIIGAAVSALLIIIGVGMGVLVWMKRKKKKKRNLGSHFLDYFLTGVTPGTSWPEFIAVAHLDGLQGGYYDSNNRTLVFRKEWIKGIKDDEHWNQVTQYMYHFQDTFKDSIATAMRLSNQTGGIHTWQWTFGCKLSDGRTKTGYSWYGYDGEDWLSLDLTTSTWTAANDKAVSIKQQWESTLKATKQKVFLEKTCFEWLQKYVDHGREILERTVPPESSLFQKNSSSQMVCHATGFYPKAMNITWQKNGEDLDEGVDLRETLPNQDGTFQRRSILTVSPEELKGNHYNCVVHHSSLEKEKVLHVVKHRAGVSNSVIIGAAVSVLLIIIGVGVGVLVWRKKRRRRNLATQNGTQ
ncbi:hypothetical protein NFI96_009256 [Prochilodus magdalenae]|nr:hypothetical protein NFI96_009256 [Prochilodus magdalenae]